MSNSLWPHEPQYTRPPCPSPTPGVHPNPCPLCWWCHPAISSSVVPFSSCPQSFPASGSFQISQLLASGGQSIRLSASTPVLPMNTQDWSFLISNAVHWMGKNRAKYHHCPTTTQATTVLATLSSYSFFFFYVEFLYLHIQRGPVLFKFYFGV